MDFVYYRMYSKLTLYMTIKVQKMNIVMTECTVN